MSLRGLKLGTSGEGCSDCRWRAFCARKLCLDELVEQSAPYSRKDATHGMAEDAFFRSASIHSFAWLELFVSLPQKRQ